MASNGLLKVGATALLLVMMATVQAAVAVTYTVGGASQWDSGVDYTSWVTGKTFRVGDTLEFKYGPSHSVDVVDKSGYDACDGSSASENHSDGDTEIELKTVGTKYYICPTSGHCESGMKLAVTVLASVSSPDTPPPPVTPPVAPSPAPDSPLSDGTHEADSGSTTPPPHAPPSRGVNSGLVSYIAMCVDNGLMS
ncbi:unnamed protein product [Microthlaspi erraticum]|uniref:Phytocyanin domain-containing protein n=1 Tax=Microthlaspi erraticum TaxID=1685480 RepID=A0A6D2K2C3_9BRAS|nr:unnamed protein product [Microthlaspi erraticum]